MRARKLVLLVCVLSLASCRDSRDPLGPPDLAGPSASLQIILNPGTPINLTDDPDWQIQADISGNTVVWADNRNGSWELWGCDLSIGLGTCATSAVRLASDVNQFGTEDARPSLSGSVMVWRSAQSRILGCDLGGGSPGPDLDECDTASEIFPSPRLQTRPKVSGGLVVWRQQIQAGSVLSHVYGCDISGGLGSCAATATQISPDGASISAPLAVGGSIVVWITETFDVAACDVSAGLDACLADPANNVVIIGEGFFPVVAGSFVVWTRFGEQDLLGCDVSSGLANCVPVNLTSSFGQAEGRSAMDESTLVWEASLFGPTLEPGIVACDISACESSVVQISTDAENPGTFPAVSGSVGVWQQGMGASGLDIMGVELAMGDGNGDPSPPLLQVTPGDDRVAFGNIGSGDSETRFVDGQEGEWSFFRVQNAGGGVLQVDVETLGAGPIEVEGPLSFQVGPDEQRVVRIRFTPADEGQYFNIITFRSNNGMHAVMVLGEKYEKCEGILAEIWPWTKKKCELIANSRHGRYLGIRSVDAFDENLYDFVSAFPDGVAYWLARIDNGLAIDMWDRSVNTICPLRVGDYWKYLEAAHNAAELRFLVEIVLLYWNPGAVVVVEELGSALAELLAPGARLNIRKNIQCVLSNDAFMFWSAYKSHRESLSARQAFDAAAEDMFLQLDPPEQRVQEIAFFTGVKLKKKGTQEAIDHIRLWYETAWLDRGLALSEVGRHREGEAIACFARERSIPESDPSDACDRF